MARLLRANGTDCFLPLARRQTKTATGLLHHEAPLFPGYVFLRGQRQDAYVADRNRRLVQIINVTDQAQLDHELQQIQQAIEAGVDLQPHPQFLSGTAVRVRFGSMEGLCGVVEQHIAPQRLILSIHTLGQAVSVEIDEDALEMIDPSDRTPTPRRALT